MPLNAGVSFELPYRADESPENAFAAADGSALEVQVCSQLMESYESGRVFTPRSRLEVHRLPQHLLSATLHSEPTATDVLFSIGSDGHFYATQTSSESSVGWQRENLSSKVGHDLPPNPVKTFATQEESDGTVALAMVVAQARTSATDDLGAAATSSRYSINVTRRYMPGAQPVWQTLPTPRDLPDVDFFVFGERDPSHEDRQDLFVAAEVDGGVSEIHRARHSEGANEDPVWTRVPLPANFDRVLQFVPGKAIRMGRGRGAYVLYQSGQTKQVAFVTIEEDPDMVPRSRVIAGLDDPTAITVYPDVNGYSELVVAAADGTFVLSAEEQTRRALLSAGAEDDTGDAVGAPSTADDVGQTRGTRIFPPQVGRVVEIVASRDEQGVPAVYGLNASGDLLHSTRLEPATWDAPSMLRRGIASVAPLRSESGVVNEFFAAPQTEASTGDVSYLWQDGGTTRWQEQPVILPDAESSRRMHVNGTRVSLKDERGMPLASTTITLTAGESASLAVNGHAHFLEANVPHPVPLSPADMGTLTITSRVEGFGLPLLKLSVPGTTQAFTIDPMGPIREELSTTSAEKIAQVASVPSETAAEAEKALRELASTALPAAYSDGPSFETLTSSDSVIDQTSLASHGVFLTAHEDPVSMALSLDHLPEDYCWSLDTSGPTPVFRGAEATRAEVLPRVELLQTNAGAGGIFDEFSRWIGNVFETIYAEARKIVSIVVERVEEGLKFMIELGGQLLTLVLKTVADVAQSINLVLKQYLGIDLEKFVEWLGLTFLWSDIKRTHEVLVAQGRAALETARQGVDTVRTRLRNELDNIQDNLEKVRNLPPGMLNKKVSGRRPNLDVPGAGKQQADYVSLMNNPAVAWTQSLLSHAPLGTIAQSWVPGFSPSDELTNRLARLLQDTFVPVVGKMRDNVEHVARDLASAFQAGTLTLGQVIQNVGLDVAELGIEVIRAVVSGLLDVAEDVLVAIEKLMFDHHLQIPLITSVYEQYIAPGHKLTVADGLCLLAAIPITIVAKAILGRLPFDEPTSAFMTPPSNSSPIWTTKSKLEWSYMCAGVGGIICATILDIIAIGRASMSSDEVDRLKALSGLEGLFRSLLGFLTVPAFRYLGEVVDVVFGWLSWAWLVGETIIDLAIFWVPKGFPSAEPIAKLAETLKSVFGPIGVALLSLAALVARVLTYTPIAKPEKPPEPMSKQAEDEYNKKVSLVNWRNTLDPIETVALFVEGAFLYPIGSIVTIIASWDEEPDSKAALLLIGGGFLIASDTLAGVRLIKNMIIYFQDPQAPKPDYYLSS